MTYFTIRTTEAGLLQCLNTNAAAGWKLHSVVLAPLGAAGAGEFICIFQK